ncbi:MAG TPA: hypothetical protein VNG12_03585 [Acidimicrobiales bacterium]|nr:hypothetical protein [Acidimicrobiales bacterium]
MGGCGCDEEVPIACTLGASELPDRLAEWQAFFGDHVEGSEPVSEQRLRLRLRDSDAALLAAASLSRREKACCAFFEFSVELGVHERWLVVSVPPGAEETLSSFAAMLRSS